MDAEPKGVTTARTAAAAVLRGAMASEQLRVRAFYPAGGLLRPVGAALAVHQRLDPKVRCPLTDGVQVARRLAGRVAFVVPAQRAHGHVRVGAGFVADWVVEELVQGTPVVSTPELVDEVLEGLAEMWRQEPVLARPASAVLPPQAWTRTEQLLIDGDEFGLWPQDVDVDAVRRALLTLRSMDPVISEVVSHGDPGTGNLLRTVDGRLALVDWEDAGRRTAAHDVVKVLAGSDLPPDAWWSRHPSLSSPGGGAPVASPPAQTAVALVGLLAGWRHRTVRARQRGSVVANRRRIWAHLSALQAALTAALPRSH